MRSQKELEITLEKLESFSARSLRLEQYPTPSHIAAEWIWSMALRSEVHGRTVLDAGCGAGILGLGLLLMGAKKVYFVDKDQKALAVAQENYKQLFDEYEVGEAEFIRSTITLFDEHVDIVVQNPPFGTQEKHADKLFLQTAFRVAPLVYSMHKWNTQEFLQAICRDYKYAITHAWRFSFPLKRTFAHHKKAIQRVDVGLWRLERQS